MFTTYRTAFRVPGAAAFSSSAFVMRLPQAMYPLGLILLISTRTHHYGFAGRAQRRLRVRGGGRQPRSAAGWSTGTASAGHPAADRDPRRRRRADGGPRPQQRARLVAAGPRVRPRLLLLPVGSLVRARWSYALEGQSAPLATAYSFESTVDELIYVLGPLAASVVATEVSGVLVLVLGAGAVGVGALLLARLRTTQPPPASGRSAAAQVGAARAGNRDPVAMVALGHGGDLRQRRGRDGGLLRPARRASVHSVRCWPRWRSAAGSRASGTAAAPGTGRSSTDSGCRRSRSAWCRGSFSPRSTSARSPRAAFVVGLAVAPALITVFGLDGRPGRKCRADRGPGLGADRAQCRLRTRRRAGRTDIGTPGGTRAAFGLTIVAATTAGLLALRLHASMRKWSRAAVPG